MEPTKTNNIGIEFINENSKVWQIASSTALVKTDGKFFFFEKGGEPDYFSSILDSFLPSFVTDKINDKKDITIYDVENYAKKFGFDRLRFKQFLEMVAIFNIPPEEKKDLLWEIKRAYMNYLKTEDLLKKDRDKKREETDKLLSEVFPELGYKKKEEKKEEKKENKKDEKAKENQTNKTK